MPAVYRLQSRVAGLLLFLCSCTAEAQITRAQVTGGWVAGAPSGKVIGFRSVPYAAPPLGDLRWRAPQPVPAWEGVRSAGAPAPVCMQRPGANPWGPPLAGYSEDCLYLNVWTGARSAEERRPVMIYIAGGGASGHASSHVEDGTGLAERGVVTVTFEFRRGVFGNLAHPALGRESAHGSGNYGLLDMIAMLNWVHTNIHAFGGDPHRVTVFGQSAGAWAVSQLQASPLAKGLIHRVIGEGGGGSFAPPSAAPPFGALMSLEAAEAHGSEFLRSLGATDLKQARTLSAETLRDAVPEMPPSGGFPTVLDGYVIPTDPYALYRAGKLNDVPVLVGFNSDEGSLDGAPPIPGRPEDIARGFVGAGADVLAESLSERFGASAVSTSSLMRSTIAWSTWKWASLQTEHGRSKAFVYYFDQTPPGSPAGAGAGHGHELRFLFRTLETPGLLSRAEPSRAERLLSDQLSQYWINFAASGNPNGAGLPTWPSFDPHRPMVLQLRSDVVAIPMPRAGEIEAFERFFSLVRERAAPRAAR